MSHFLNATKLEAEPYPTGLDAWYLGWNGRWWRACRPDEVLPLLREVRAQDRTKPSDHQELHFYENGVQRRRFTFSTRSFRSREAGGRVARGIGGGLFECLGR